MQTWPVVQENRAKNLYTICVSLNNEYKMIKNKTLIIKEICPWLLLSLDGQEGKENVFVFMFVFMKSRKK